MKNTADDGRLMEEYSLLYYAITYKSHEYRLFTHYRRA